MAEEKNSCSFKIVDYLVTRDKQTNFGSCRRCKKRVYWSTNKVVSHIRSGHCTAAPLEEIERFKKDFVYQSPKNLVHRTKLKINSKDDNDTKSYLSTSIKKRSSEIRDEMDEHETLSTEQEEPVEAEHENFEILFVADEQNCQPTETTSTEDQKQEEKFINVVYPQFKNKTKLQLIDEILELQRRNDLLQDKTKTYENTIKRLL